MTHAIRIHATGGPEALLWEPVEVPRPGAGEVLLRQTAIGVNFIDVYHRKGVYPAPSPFTPGVEAVGIVETVGPDVAWPAAGDRVAYATVLGSYAERRIVPAARLVPVPDIIGDETAAAMLLRGMTARFLLKQTTNVKAGQTILVHAAAGGVGLLLCQWAAALGATVIGTVSSEAKAELAGANGCHHPIVMTGADFYERTQTITDGKGVAVVYDSIGKDTADRSLLCLAPRGMMVLYGQASGPVAPIDPARLAAGHSLYLTRPSLFDYVAERADLEAAAADLFAALADGILTVRIGQSFPLSEAADAHRALESRQTMGSTILMVR